MTLELQHITHSFDGRPVLSDVSLTVDSGEVVALLGRNGAGKTTLLRIATLLLAPDGGRVLFDGHPMVAADMAAIGYLPEERGLYRHLRAGEQALYLMRLKGLSKADAEVRLRGWFDRLGMSQWWDTKVSKLSKGMQQRLQFVVSVAHGPRLLVLDEPFSGFDQENAEMLLREIKRLASEGTAVLLSTHNMQAVSDICDKTLRL